MKKIAIVALCLVAVACQAVTPVKDLLLQGDANGNAQSITNLSDVVLTNGLRLSTATGGSGSTCTMYRVYGTGLVSVASEYGPAALVSVDVDGIRSGLATGTPLYVESGTGTLISASLDPYMTSAATTSAFVRKDGDTMTGSLIVSGVVRQVGQYILSQNSTNSGIYTWLSSGGGSFPPFLSMYSGSGNGVVIVGNTNYLGNYGPLYRWKAVRDPVMIWDTLSDGTNSDTEVEAWWLGGYVAASYPRTNAANFGSITANTVRVGTTGPTIAALGSTNVTIGGVRVVLAGEASGGAGGAVTNVGYGLTGNGADLPLSIIGDTSYTGTFTGTFTGNGLGITNSPSSGASTPYTLTPAGTVVLATANGYWQSLTPAAPTVIQVQLGAAANVESIRLDLYAGTNSITFATSNTYGASSLSINHTNTTAILFDSPFQETLWRVHQLSP